MKDFLVNTVKNLSTLNWWSYLLPVLAATATIIGWPVLCAIAGGTAWKILLCLLVAVLGGVLVFFGVIAWLTDQKVPDEYKQGMILLAVGIPLAIVLWAWWESGKTTSTSGAPTTSSTSTTTTSLTPSGASSAAVPLNVAQARADFSAQPLISVHGWTPPLWARDTDYVGNQKVAGSVRVALDRWAATPEAHVGNFGYAVAVRCRINPDDLGYNFKWHMKLRTNPKHDWSGVITDPTKLPEGVAKESLVKKEESSVKRLEPPAWRGGWRISGNHDGTFVIQVRSDHTRPVDDADYQFARPEFDGVQEPANTAVIRLERMISPGEIVPWGMLPAGDHLGHFLATRGHLVFLRPNGTLLAVTECTNPATAPRVWLSSVPPIDGAGNPTDWNARLAFSDSVQCVEPIYTLDNHLQDAANPTYMYVGLPVTQTEPVFCLAALAIK